jgi:hypothetical protein
MTPQEKLDKIDAMLYKEGFCKPSTVNKVAEIIQEYIRYKCRAEHNKSVIDAAMEELGNGS